MFGPALIEALCLEKNRVYPRIALTPEAVQIARDVAPDSGHGDPAEAPVVLTPLCGEDGSVFVNVSACGSQRRTILRRSIICFHYRRRIEDGLKLTSDVRPVQAKWQWMADYFNYALSGSVLSEFKTGSRQVSTVRRFAWLVACGCELAFCRVEPWSTVRCLPGTVLQLRWPA